MEEILHLLKQAKKGDISAFNELVLQHQEPAYNYACYMLRDDALAKDVTQDSFISAYKSIKKLTHDNFKAWLFRIIHNKCIDVLRKQKRRPSLSMDAVVEENESAYFLRDTQTMQPEKAYEQVETAEAIEQCLQRLSHEQRSVVILCDIEGYDYASIAEILSISKGTVKSRISRSRSKLQTCLQSILELFRS